MLRKAVWALTFLLLLAIAACDSEAEDDSFVSSAGAGGTIIDNRFKPDPNGVPISETDACDILQSTVQDKALALSCSKTVRTCPGFLRVQYDPDCVQYDEGTVTGCRDYYNSILTCDELVEESCALVVLEGTEPNGCP